MVINGLSGYSVAIIQNGIYDNNVVMQFCLTISKQDHEIVYDVF